MISLIVAASTNNVIGAQGGLPWRLPSDLRRFKSLTMGKPIVMGRVTHESIGRALPGRQNIVITRQAGYAADGCDVVESIEAAIAKAGSAREIMVIGGSQIYEQCLPLADRVYLTRVHAEVEGDAFLPELAPDEWHEVARESLASDESNEFDVAFITLDRPGKTVSPPQFHDE